MGDEWQEHTKTHQITVFSVSAAMAGVCLSAISTTLVLEHLTKYETVCDVLFMLAMLLFLVASMTSYMAYRLHFRGPWKFLHQTADITILVGMVLMVFSAGVLVLALL